MRKEHEEKIRQFMLLRLPLDDKEDWPEELEKLADELDPFWYSSDEEERKEVEALFSKLRADYEVTKCSG